MNLSTLIGLPILLEQVFKRRSIGVCMVFELQKCLADMDNLMKLIILTACIAVLQFQCAVAQVETPNDQCGGYFRTARGSINFRITDETVPPDTVFPKICIWTIMPLYDQQMYYTVNVTSNMTTQNTLRVNGNRNRTITIDSKQITQASGDVDVTGPLMVVILTIRQRQSQNGFLFRWKERRTLEDFMGAAYVGKIHYSWGRPSNEPLPYFAATFYGPEMSAFGFPKANDTQTAGYTFQIVWETLLFGDPCPEGTPNSNCRTHDYLMACRILDDGSLVPQEIYYRSGNYTNLDPIENQNGFYLIVWTTVRGGGRFQMEYATIRA